jgi:hypothetical protein
MGSPADTGVKFQFNAGNLRRAPGTTHRYICVDVEFRNARLTRPARG